MLDFEQVKLVRYNPYPTGVHRLLEVLSGDAKTMLACLGKSKSFGVVAMDTKHEGNVEN